MPFDQQQATILQHISEYGISLSVNGPCAHNPDQKPYIYTVGMTGIGAPELICFGLAPRIVGPYLNTIFQQISQKTRRPDLRRDDDFWTFVTYFDDVETAVAREYATDSFDFYREFCQVPKFKQMVYPDQRGFYPFEAQCSEEIKAIQPYLGTRKRRDADHDPSFSLN